MKLITLFCAVIASTLTLAACANGGREDGSMGGGPLDEGGIGLGEGGALVESGAIQLVTCEDAANAHSYIGCDYWPTPVANIVWSVFDFTVVVSNTGDTPADITITGPNGYSSKGKADPGTLTKIYLPWVPELKGGDGNECGARDPAGAFPVPLHSLSVPKSAYHLVTSRPVVVYQFNALEYQPKGGPEGKDWSPCPGNKFCGMFGRAVGCFSYSNDASLLLPSTALTGTYRVTGPKSDGDEIMPSYFAVTGTQDGTTVTVHVGKYGRIEGGGNIASTLSNGTATFTLDAGDVAEVVGVAKYDVYKVQSYSSDFSGSLVTANKPIQIISGIQCIGNPFGVQACDHLEQTVFPAESLGHDYVVTVPTGPNGTAVGHTVRLYGNFDGTTLTYNPAPPPICDTYGNCTGTAPTTINAGDVVDLPMVTSDFRVQGSQAFAVATIQLSATYADPATPILAKKGDPSLSNAIAVAQYRSKYVFLAPDDYDVSYVDVVAPNGAQIVLDGASIGGARTAVGTSGYELARIKLGPGNNGSHLLTSSAPVGIQVMGYGAQTSYQYPGGSDFISIAPIPVK